MSDRLPVPSFDEERKLQAKGFHYIAGIDEVGRGALAGPVFAAAVVLPPRIRGQWQHRVRDSKLLSAAQRELLAGYIDRVAIAIGIGSIEATVIDTHGILKATQMAMRQAVSRLSPPAEALLIDYMALPGVTLPQKGVIEGDSLCFSIACASIVAKVARDHLMTEFEETYPGYAFAHNKGYGTAEHLTCLSRLGPCPIHRRSFQPVKDVMSRAFEEINRVDDI